jgi:hypothetical protein
MLDGLQAKRYREQDDKSKTDKSHWRWIEHEEGGDGPGGEEWKFLKFTNHNKTQQI